MNAHETSNASAKEYCFMNGSTATRKAALMSLVKSNESL